MLVLTGLLGLVVAGSMMDFSFLSRSGDKEEEEEPYPPHEDGEDEDDEGEALGSLWDDRDGTADARTLPLTEAEAVPPGAADDDDPTGAQDWPEPSALPETGTGEGGNAADELVPAAPAASPDASSVQTDGSEEAASRIGSVDEGASGDGIGDGAEPAPCPAGPDAPAMDPAAPPEATDPAPAQSLLGGSGDDILAGGSGDDILLGGEGDDHLIGGEGDDTLRGDAGDDSLEGGLGDDHLDGGAGRDTLYGNDGNDALTGIPADPANDSAADADYLNGGRGNDTLILGAGDTGTGGEDADTFVLGDWLMGGDAVAVIADYDPAEDQIVLAYDPEAHPDPDVTVETEGETTHVLIDGIRIAEVTRAAGLTADDILLVGTPEILQSGLPGGIALAA